MRALVVYESMFGNTHEIATEVAEGLRSRFGVDVVAVAAVTPELVAAADLLVVGGPTHAHSMTSAQSRKGAPDYVEKSGGDLHLEPGYDGPGLRDWFTTLPKVHGLPAAAFDTRVDMSAMLSGRASKGIASRLTKHGYRLVVDPESFLVDKHNHLLPGEGERARDWGADLRTVVGSATNA